MLNFKNWGKWNLCLLAGKGVEMGKKPLYWVSRHLFFPLMACFLLSTNLKLKRCWNSRTVGSSLWIFLGQIAKKPLNTFSKRVLPYLFSYLPIKIWKLPNCKGCRKQNDDSAYWWGLGKSSETPILCKFQNTILSSRFPIWRCWISKTDWGKWNLCLLAGNGVEMGKKPWYWVSKHLFYTYGMFSLIYSFEHEKVLKFKACRK